MIVETAALWMSGVMLPLTGELDMTNKKKYRWVQGGPFGCATLFVDIMLKVLPEPELKLLIKYVSKVLALLARHCLH